MSSADVSSSISVISTYVSRLQGNEKIMNQINASLSGEERHVSLKKVKAREILYANSRNYGYNAQIMFFYIAFFAI